MLQNAVSKNRDHTRQKFYQPCCNSFINHVQPKQTQNAIFHALSFIPSYLFSSRSVSPDTQHTHCEANTTDTAPHKLNPLLLSCAPLDLLAIDVVSVLIHNALLQALLHGEVQASARCGHNTSPEQVWVSNASRTESESSEE